MNRNKFSNVDLFLLLLAFISAGLTVPVSDWLVAHYSQPVSLVSVWTLLYFPAAWLVANALGRLGRQH